jgi:excisionase family DNA binding protein
MVNLVEMGVLVMKYRTDEKLYEPSEIATEFNVSHSSVVRWLKKGDLHGFKIGSKWKVPETSLKMFIEKSTST